MFSPSAQRGIGKSDSRSLSLTVYFSHFLLAAPLCSCIHMNARIMARGREKSHLIAHLYKYILIKFTLFNSTSVSKRD